MFRKEAITRRKKKWRDRALLLPGVPLWLTLGLYFIFLVVFLAFVTLSNYTRQVNVSREIATSPRAINVSFGVQGFVVKTFITEDDGR